MDGYTDALVLRATELWWPTLGALSSHPLRPGRSFFAAVTDTAVAFPHTTKVDTSAHNNGGSSVSVGLSRLGCSIFLTATLQQERAGTTQGSSLCVSVWCPYTSEELTLPVVRCPPDLAKQVHDAEKCVMLSEMALSNRIRIVPADITTYCASSSPTEQSIGNTTTTTRTSESEVLYDLLFARYRASMHDILFTFLHSVHDEGGYCGVLIDGAADSGKAEFMRHVQRKLPACFDVVRQSPHSNNNTKNDGAKKERLRLTRTRYVVEHRKISFTHLMTLDEREAIETVAVVLQPPPTQPRPCTAHNNNNDNDDVNDIVSVRPLVYVTLEHVDLLWSEPLTQAPLIARCVAHELCMRLDQLAALHHDNNESSDAVFFVCSVAESGVTDAMPLLGRLARHGQLRLEIPTLDERVRYLRLKLCGEAPRKPRGDDATSTHNTSNEEEEDGDERLQAALEVVAEEMSSVTIPQLLALSAETLRARVKAVKDKIRCEDEAGVRNTHAEPTSSSSAQRTTSDIPEDTSALAPYYGHLFGVEDLVRRVEELIVWPLTHLPLLRRMNIPCPRGLLLCGPSGTGKTALLTALARRMRDLHRVGLHTMVLDGLSLITKEVGRSERNIAELFAQARALAPTALFLDNLDALAPPRGRQSSESNITSDRTLSTLLTEMDGVQADARHLVVVLASAPSLESLDAAVCRPGRLDIHLTLPGLSASVAATAVVSRLAAFRTRMQQQQQQRGNVTETDSKKSDDEEDERWQKAVCDYVHDYVAAHSQESDGNDTPRVSAAQMVAAVRDVLLHLAQHPEVEWKAEELVRLLRRALDDD